MSTHYVIVGGGVAGFRAAKELRRAQESAQITVFSEERYPFYLRRQLGDLLAGNLTAGELVVQSRNAYRRERIDLFLMTRVVRVEPPAHEVVLDSGQRVQYDRLLIATGTRAVPLAIPGSELEGVVTVDTLAAAIALERVLAAASRVVVLDEGVIGLRLAEALASRGLEVTLLAAGERLWPTMLDASASALVEAILKDSGVAIRRGAARAIVGAGSRAIGVETAEGEVLAAEAVISGGIRRPAIDILEGSGIEVHRGIRVDAALRASAPDVFAAGDVADPVTPSAWGPEEHPLCWQRAWSQGGVAAASMRDRPADRTADIVRTRTILYGHDLAVIGRGHLEEGGGIEAICRLAQAPAEDAAPREDDRGEGEPDLPRREPASRVHTYRRLVFDEGRLVGAVLFGPAEWYPQVVRMIADRAPREVVEHTLGLSGQPASPDVVPQSFAQHCPICAAELVVHHGTPLGAVIPCGACRSHLKVCWDGKRGWLEATGGGE